ncbi:MAG TPA: hypothetical protein VEH53_05980 [archaeon]|nr:hypothetical protein [archaeon]
MLLQPRIPPALRDTFRTPFEEEPSEIFVQSMCDAGDYESELQIGLNKKNLLDLKDKGMIGMGAEALGPDMISKQSA